MAASGGVRAHAHRPGRVPRRAATGVSRCSCGSPGSTTTTTIDAIEKLDEFVCAAQRIFDSFGGNLLQLTLGDKGAYFYAVFGSPIAHEDDAARAAAAALEVRELEATTAATEIQIGITHGRLRSGTYGHEARRTFVCLGDAVQPLRAPDGKGAAWADLRLRARADGRR